MERKEKHGFLPEAGALVRAEFLTGHGRPRTRRSFVKWPGPSSAQGPPHEAAAAPEAERGKPGPGAAGRPLPGSGRRSGPGPAGTSRARCPCPCPPPGRRPLMVGAEPLWKAAGCLFFIHFFNFLSSWGRPAACATGAPFAAPPARVG